MSTTQRQEESEIYSLPGFNPQSGAHLGWERLANLAATYGLKDYEVYFRSRSHDKQSRAGFPAHKADSNRVLLIKSWTHGFWSEVSHFLGGCLLAELTGRQPLVHWGEASLYCPEGVKEAFALYFKPPFVKPRLDFSDVIEDGDTARTPAQIMARTEPCVATSHYLSVYDLSFWLPPGHPREGQSCEQLYRGLVRDYLHPVTEVCRAVEDFLQNQPPGPFLALHLRGTDKETELDNLAQLNRDLLHMAQATLNQSQMKWIWVMTDCARLEHAARKIFGASAVISPLNRSLHGVPLHYAPERDPFVEGRQILIESLIASRSARFLGNGRSNVSAMIAHLRDWPEGAVRLLAPSQLYQHQPATYR